MKDINKFLSNEAYETKILGEKYNFFSIFLAP